MAPVLVKSVSDSQSEILHWIQDLHCPDGFECDVTYGHGKFYTDIAPPRLRFDIEPQVCGVVRADSRLLPLPAGSVGSVVFDPPFLTYVKNGRAHKNGAVAMASRFGGYYTYAELEDHYHESISEASRIIRDGGKLIVKCQDIVHNHRLHATHQRVLEMARMEGFRLLDLFILLGKNRMPGPQSGQQRHARVWHSYFLVFEKVPAGRKV